MKTSFVAAALSFVSLVALTSAVGCSAPADDSAITGDDAEINEDGSKIVPNKTVEFGGKFEVAYGGMTDRPNQVYLFSVEDIDWSAGKATWRSYPKGEEKLTKILPMTVSLARCPGCAELRTEDGKTARISIANGGVSSLAYGNDDVVKTTVTKVISSSGSSSGSSGEPAAKGGSCTLSCNGSTYGCVEVASKADCTIDAFESRPRCPSDVTYAAGETCN